MGIDPLAGVVRLIEAQAKLQTATYQYLHSQASVNYFRREKGMKKLDGKKMDALMNEETIRGIDIEEHLRKQHDLLTNLEDSEEFIGRIETMAHATVALIKANGSESAMRALMSGIVEGVCLGIEIGQECAVEETEFDCPSLLDVERKG